MATNHTPVTLETLAAMLAQQQERLDILECHNATLSRENEDLRVAVAASGHGEVTEVEPAPASIIEQLSRRWVLRRGLQVATASAVIAASVKHQTAHAAPLTSAWLLGGNTAVNTDGTNFLGTTNVAPLVFKTAAVNNTPLERMRITEAGNVGIGFNAPTAKLQVYGTSYAVYGRHNATTGAQSGVYGETLATVDNASGVQGVVKPTAPGVGSAGVLGKNSGTNGNGSGVLGTHAGDGYGVQGTAVGGTGVYGKGPYSGVTAEGTAYGVLSYATGADSTAVYASGDGYGVQAWSSGLYGVYGNAGTYGVYGVGSYGVYGSGSSRGVRAVGGTYGLYATGSSYGVYGDGATGVSGSSNTTSGVAVYGFNGYYAVHGEHGSNAGVRGDSPYAGVWGEGATFGVFSRATGTSGVNYGIYALTDSSGGYAGYFQGNVAVTGSVSKAAGSFKIDHPLDPENKYLSHSFVESPDMMNVYNGNVTTDANGQATITLPAYFAALNRDFRYQLTTLGQLAQAAVIKEIADNQFTIKTDKPNVKVSWQVTGIRQDAYATAHPILVEEDKAAAERGLYLHPEVHGKSADHGLANTQQPRESTDYVSPSAPTEPPAPPVPPTRHGAPSVVPSRSSDVVP